jgi:exosortase
LGAAAGFLLIALAGFAYRELFSYDPYAFARLDISPENALFFSPAIGHPALVLTLTAWVVVVRVRRVAPTPLAGGAAAVAALLLLPALALALWAYHVSAPAVLVPSLALAILGLGILLLGGRAGWVLLPAALLALFVSPVQPVLANQILYPLQLATTRFATVLLELSGNAPLSMGVMIQVGGQWFDVIEACSGYASMVILTLASLVFVGLFRRHRAVACMLVIAAPLLAFVFNGLRVVSLVLNPDSELADVHETQGLLMVAAGSVAFVVLDRLLVRALPTPPVPLGRGDVQSTDASRESLRWAIAGALAVGLAIASVALPRPVPTLWPEFTLTEVPVRLGPWEAEGLPIDRRFFGTTRFSAWLHRLYARPDGAFVELFLGTDDGQYDHTGVLSTKLHFPGPGWTVESSGHTTLKRGATDVEVYEVARLDEIRRVFLWRRPGESVPREILRSLFSVEKSPLGRGRRTMVVRLTAPMGADWRGRVAADRQLRDFADFILRVLPELERPYDEHRKGRDRDA